MNLDYNKIKEILSIFEANDKPTLNTLQIFSTLNYNTNKQDDFDIVWHYLKLLNDQALIECLNDNEKNLGISFAVSGQPIISIKKFRLTMTGYQTLEAMTTNKIWDKIKEIIISFGIEGIKKIPALAVKIISEQHI